MTRAAHATLVGAALLVPTGLLFSASPATAETGAQACQYDSSGHFSDAATSYYARLCEKASPTKAQIEYEERLLLEPSQAVAVAETSNTSNQGSSLPSTAIAAGAISLLGAGALAVGIVVTRSRSGGRRDGSASSPTDVSSLPVSS